MVGNRRYREIRSPCSNGEFVIVSLDIVILFLYSSIPRIKKMVSVGINRYDQGSFEKPLRIRLILSNIEIHPITSNHFVFSLNK